MTPSDQSRRAFLSHGIATGVAGLAASGLAPSPLLAAAATKAASTPSHLDVRAKLKSISSRAKQLWPVIYVETEKLTETLERDIEASLEGGADAVVLEIGKNVPALTQAVKHAKTKYPKAKIGANYLGDDDDQYGYKTGFRLAREYDLDIVWTDFCGVDLVQELPEISLHAIEAARAPRAFYCSGIHMKYGTLKDPNKLVETSALQAMGWVDGIIITGPRTGIPTDPERAVRVRSVIRDYPLGAASGVSVDNFASIRDQIDFCLVNTSISDANHRIQLDKIKKLRQVMGA